MKPKMVKQKKLGGFYEKLERTKHSSRDLNQKFKGSISQEQIKSL